MKWFDDLKEDEKKYLEEHEDPSHMIKFVSSRRYGRFRRVAKRKITEEHLARPRVRSAARRRPACSWPAVSSRGRGGAWGRGAEKNAR